MFSLLLISAPPSAPTLNPPLCSARDPASALVTVSWLDDGFNYTLDGAPINCTLQNPCHIDRSLQFSENRTFTLKAIDSPPSGCGKDLISEGSVLETTVEEGIHVYWYQFLHFHHGIMFYIYMYMESRHIAVVSVYDRYLLVIILLEAHSIK